MSSIEIVRTSGSGRGRGAGPVDRAFRLLHAETLSDRRRDLLNFGAKPSAGDVPVALELGDH